MFRESSPRVALGDHVCRANKQPLTFQTWERILDICSFSENLNRKLFGPRTAKEKGFAKKQALVKAAFTVWLFWIF
jgi:hypothetical protein